MKQQYCVETLVSLKSDMSALIHYCLRYLVEQRSLKFSIESGNYLYVKRENFLSLMNRIFLGDLYIVETKEFQSYLKRGVPNRCHHYSLSSEFSFDEISEMLIKLILKKDKINVQRYLERAFRNDVTKSFKFLKKISLMDDEWYDLHEEFNALENWYFQVTKEDRIVLLSYVSSLLTSRHLNIIQDLAIIEKISFHEIVESKKTLLIKLRECPSKEYLKSYYFLKNLLQAYNENEITEEFFIQKASNAIILKEYSKNTSIDSFESFYLESAIHD